MDEVEEREPARDGFERFVVEHATTVLGLASLITRDHATARQAVDAAWPDLYRRWPRIAAGRHVMASALAPFVAGAVAGSTKPDGSRGSARRGLELLDDVTVDGETVISRDQDAHSLTVAFDDLAPRERALVALKHFAGVEERDLGWAVRWRPPRAADAARRLTRELRLNAAPVEDGRDRDDVSGVAVPFTQQLQRDLAARTALADVDGQATLAALRPKLVGLSQVRERRTPGRRVLVGAAALTVLAGVGIGIAVHDHNDSHPSLPAAMTPPRAADGMRLTGYRSISVAIPQAWQHNAVACGRAAADTTIYEDAIRSSPCTLPIDRVSRRLQPSSVTFSDAALASPSLYGIRKVGSTFVGAIYATPPMVRDGITQRIVVVPDANVQIVIRSLEAGLVQRIIDSVESVPPGYTTVPPCVGLPLRDAVGLLGDSGLQVRLTQASTLSARESEPPVTHQTIASGEIVPLTTVVGLGFPSMN